MISSDKTIEEVCSLGIYHSKPIGRKFEWSSIAQLLDRNKPTSVAM